MKDYRNNELNIDDSVVCVIHTKSSSWLKEAVVVGFTKSMVRLLIAPNTVILKTSEKIIKI